MKTASVIDTAIAVEAEFVLDGQIVFEVSCNDYDHFKSLPSVLSYRNVQCKKTGWTSDRNRACYKQSLQIAYSK